MSNNQTAAAQVNGQNTNTKGEVKTMTNKAMNFVLVNSKEVVSVNTREKVVFPVQVRMTLEVNGKTQSVAFGYNRMGGRQTYMVPEGKAPYVLSRAEFIKKLRASNILNMKQVEHYLGQIRSFHRDEFVVAKCECCGTGLVTAANIDFVQRNHAKLTEKLGREVTAFSKLCYTCQGHEGKKTPAKQQEKAPVIPASAEKATCSHCNKAVSQKVAEFSLKTHGRILCFKPCQSKFPKLDKQQQQPAKQEPANTEAPAQQQPPVTPPVSQEKVTTRDELLTPALVAEIMALEVDPFSEIAKLQRELDSLYRDDQAEMNTLWHELHQECVARSASEASVPMSHICAVCDAVLPEAADFCEPCAAEVKATNDKIMGLSASEASKMTQTEEPGVGPASEASTARQEEEDVAPSEEDAKEVPQAESTDETVCKSPESDDLSNGSHNMNDTREAIMSFMEEACYQFQDSDVPPMTESNELPF